MRTEKLRALVPFLLMEGVLGLAMLMLWQLDWLVHNTLYTYHLVFSLDWAVPYWTFFRISFGLLVFAVAAVAVVGYGSYKKAKKESEKIVFLCKSCGNAWSKVDRNVSVGSKLPRFKIVKSCPSCNKNLSDEESVVVESEALKARKETPVFAEASKSEKS
jgi:hypothetical protein